MAKHICQKCGQEKTLANFIGVKESPLFDGYLPICRECLATILAKAPEEEVWNLADRLCQWANIPFVPEEWQKCYEGYGNNAFGYYVSIFREQEYSKLNWNEYNQVYLQLEEEQRVEDALPLVKEQQLRKWRQKWGEVYSEAELEYLENLHQGLLQSQNVAGALNEDQALKLCKISLIIEDKIREGADFSKDLKSYDELAKLANLTPKNVKEASEFDSMGEVFAYMEKTGTVLPYYDDVVRDEVDFCMKNMLNYLRYLYVNETGVAEEIEHRIENLKIAAELEGNEFDEQDLRHFIRDQQELEDEDHEDFKIDF